MSTLRDKMKDKQAQLNNAMGLESMARGYTEIFKDVRKAEEAVKEAQRKLDQHKFDLQSRANELGDQARLLGVYVLNIKAGVGRSDTMQNVLVRVSLPGVSEAGQTVTIENLIEL